jgi:hypothetical protein
METATIANPQTLPIVRARVQDILTRSAAFRQLPEAQRRELAHDMVTVANYIAGGERPGDTPASIALTDVPATAARALADTASDQMKRSGAAAGVAGVDEYKSLVQTVDFPAFVGGLIDGVFTAIVDSSIKQMQAYAELVKNVAKSVGEFMRDNTTDNQARDWLADRYPDHLEVDTSEDTPKLKPKEGYDEENLPDFFKELGLPAPIDSLDESTTEEVLVPAGRRRMAMDRQQLLATMVMMGINRIVVTNGSISASCLFEVNTTDAARRQLQRNRSYEDVTTSSWKGDQGGGSFNWSNGGLRSRWYKGTYDISDNATFKVSTTGTDDSESKVDLHGKLSGKVDLRFKSDYFPLERMTEMLGINQQQIQQQAAPTGAPATVPPGQQPGAVPAQTGGPATGGTGAAR